MRIPKLCRNPDGRAFSIVPQSRKRVYFGKFGEPATEDSYRKWVAQIIANPASPDVKLPSGSTIARMSISYMEWAESYYSKQGDFPNVRSTQDMLIEKFGRLRGESFGPVRLTEFQRSLIGRGLARTTINAHMGRVRRFFRWCESRELIPRGTVDSLKTVLPLMPGRSEAPESVPVIPVEWDAVRRTLPYLSPPVAAAVQVQYLCGMRPDEVLRMRAGEIDQSREIWLWRPERHKNSHRLQSLTKAIPGPAQSILAGLLKTKRPDQFIFDPSDSTEWAASHRPKRKTKLFPYEMRLKQKRPGRKLLPRYSESRYGKEITKAIAEANSAIQEESAKIPHWTPNQLRHAIATEVSARIGEQASQRYLGHARLETTSIYTAAHERELIEIASQLQGFLQSQISETRPSKTPDASTD